MDSITIAIITAIIALLAGIVLGKIIFARDTQKKIQDAESQAQQITTEAQLKAQTIKKEKELEAKEKFVQLKSEFDKEDKKGLGFGLLVQYVLRYNSFLIQLSIGLLASSLLQLIFPVIRI